MQCIIKTSSNAACGNACGPSGTARWAVVGLQGVIRFIDWLWGSGLGSGYRVKIPHGSKKVCDPMTACHVGGKKCHVGKVECHVALIAAPQAAQIEA